MSGSGAAEPGQKRKYTANLVQKTEKSVRVFDRPATICRSDLSATLYTSEASESEPRSASEHNDPAGCTTASHEPQQNQASAAPRAPEGSLQTSSLQTKSESKPGRGRKERPCFRYGNYHSYYGYRGVQLGGQLASDPRLTVFRREWFEGKRLMDLGCNDGLVSLQCATRFSCSSVHGIDIDPALVKKANKALGRMRRELRETLREGQEAAAEAPREVYRSLANVKFDCANIVSLDDQLCADASADVVLCLSVSKWVHLNWGDEGLLGLFGAVFRVLAPGGLFVLEPQPWKSYRQAFRKQQMPEECKRVMDAIAIFPDQFAHILQQRVGFVEVETLAVEGSSQGFDRPVLMCRKPMADVDAVAPSGPSDPVAPDSSIDVAEPNQPSAAMEATHGDVAVASQPGDALAST